MTTVRVGLDLAKNVFQVHGVDEHGAVTFKKQIKRAQVSAFFAQLPPALVGMEACGGAHYWARVLTALGHDARIMAAEFVRPYVKSNKNDELDAEAICEAVGRPNMRFVAGKTVDQQAVLSLHRAREAMVCSRTAEINRVHGLMAEFGIVVAQGLRSFLRDIPCALDAEADRLPVSFTALIQTLMEHVKDLDRLAQQIECEIKRWHLAHEYSKRLEQVPGIGPITATALIATIGDSANFSNGRQLAAWLGLVSRQHSSGGKSRMLGISKRGDCYVRKLLVHGARAVIRVQQNKASPEAWLAGLLARRHANVAAVALANKNARTVWAMLRRGEDYRRPAAV
jgi:transposase